MASNYYARQNPKIYPQGLYEESSTQKLPLGTVWELADGRSYRYCKNGSGALTMGMMLQTAALDSLATSMVLSTAASIGDDHLHVTYGAGTTATANYFKEGFALITEVAVGVGGGQLLKIASHAAATSGGELILYLTDYVRVACAITTTQVTCVKHKCDSVVAYPTTSTGVAVGVAPRAVTAAYYFWAQFKGPCAVVVDTGETLVIGDLVSVPPGTVAGAVDVAVETEIDQRVGAAHVIGAADTFAVIDLNLI